MSNLVLQCQNLSKTFLDGASPVEVLDNVSLEVKQGEMLGILGASGSGKSTLLHLLGGLDKPSEGRVYIQGQDVSHVNQAQISRLRNQKLGFVYQFHHLLPEFSALENVAMPLLMSGLSVTEAHDKAAAILSEVGLAKRLSHPPAKLSGGERQRTAIARAIVTKPACVLADEPTGNLDSKTAHAVFDLLLKLNEDLACSFVVVTHDIELSKKMQRTVHIVDGKLNN